MSFPFEQRNPALWLFSQLAALELDWQKEGMLSGHPSELLRDLSI
jgi:hypothetical protein